MSYQVVMLYNIQVCNFNILKWDECQYIECSPLRWWVWGAASCSSPQSRLHNSIPFAFVSIEFFSTRLNSQNRDLNWFSFQNILLLLNIWTRYQTRWTDVYLIRSFSYCIVLFSVGILWMWLALGENNRRFLSEYSPNVMKISNQRKLLNIL